MKKGDNLSSEERKRIIKKFEREFIGKLNTYIEPSATDGYNE